MLLRDFLKLQGPDLHGKRPDTLYRHSFVNFLCDWAQNGCVNNSAREDGRAKHWQLLCYEICIHCIKHSVWHSAVRPFLSVFIVHRQRDQDVDGNGLLSKPRCCNTPSFSSDVPGMACGSPLSNTVLMRPGSLPRSPPPLLCSPDTADWLATSWISARPSLTHAAGHKGAGCEDGGLSRVCPHRWETTSL